MSTRHGWRRTRTWVIVGSAALVSVALTSDTAAQKRPRPPRQPSQARRTATDRSGDLVDISYPDSVNLAAFVDYVSQSLDVKIIYGDEVRNQVVVFRPGEVRVPKDQLLDLLRSMLRMQDLALVEGDVEGWLRIVQTGDMQRHISEIRRKQPEQDITRSNRVVAQVVQIASADMQTVVKHASRFLSSPKASVIEVPDKKLIIITDYESATARAIEIIRLLDSAPSPAQIVTVPVRHQEVDRIAERVAKVLGDKAQLEGTKELQVVLRPDPNSASILLVGRAESLEEVRELIERFDVPPDSHRVTVTYEPQHITADRLMRLIENVVAYEPLQQETMRLFTDEETNRLYVTAAPDVHEKIAGLLAVEDVESLESSRPLCIYRPKNRLARDLIGCLSDVLPEVMSLTLRRDEPVRRDGKSNPRVPPGPNRPPGSNSPGQAPPIPPAQEPIETAAPYGSQVARVEGQDFVLSYDDHTNSIIAIGPREFHTKLQALLAELDKRRPQVLIEMTLVAVTFNDSLSLAIELATKDKHSGYESLLFSSFGLSNVDLATGARVFNPGGGLNSVILGPDETPFLLRAIAAHGNSRVITTPKVIVSDNTTASIGSVEEAPFTSINASDTVATTSFAGFESAGTVLTVTPHIAQGDHLTLDYSLNFSNFTGGGSVGVPPPRTTNTFSGTVEIPDSHTIIVGGLVTENEADSVTEVPLLGRVPVVGALFQSSDRARTKSRIYAFIRATVLRDDRFADLKLVSRGEIDHASLENSDYPSSEYLWMR